jgi:hypothetical protein
VQECIKQGFLRAEDVQPTAPRKESSRKQAIEKRIHTQNPDPQVRKAITAKTREGRDVWKDRKQEQERLYLALSPALVCGSQCCPPGTLWPSCPAHSQIGIERFVYTNQGKNVMQTILFNLKRLEVENKITVKYDKHSGLFGIREFALSPTGQESDLAVGFPSSALDKEKNDRERHWTTAGFREAEKGRMRFDPNLSNTKRIRLRSKQALVTVDQDSEDQDQPMPQAQPVPVAQGPQQPVPQAQGAQQPVPQAQGSQPQQMTMEEFRAKRAKTLREEARKLEARASGLLAEADMKRKKADQCEQLNDADARAAAGALLMISSQNQPP